MELPINVNIMFSMEFLVNGVSV